MADCARRHLPHCFQEREMLYFVRGLFGTLLSVFESYAAAEGCETQAADDTKREFLNYLDDGNATSSNRLHP